MFLKSLKLKGILSFRATELELRPLNVLIITTHADILINALSGDPKSVVGCERDPDLGTSFERLSAKKLNLCLIDSDRSDDSTTWRELLQRKDWRPRWRRLRTPQRKHAHWMVQVMEAWFLADRAALRRYYGQQFRERGIPGAESTVEDIGNPASVLRTATRDTRKRQYHKTQHAPDLLESVDRDRVRRNAPACERLFSTLERVLQ